MALNSSLSVFRPLRSIVYVSNIQFRQKLYDLKIESVFSFDSSFYIKKTFQ